MKSDFALSVSDLRASDAYLPVASAMATVPCRSLGRTFKLLMDWAPLILQRHTVLKVKLAYCPDSLLIQPLRTLLKSDTFSIFVRGLSRARIA